MTDNLRILFIEDEPMDVQIASYELQREGLAFASRTVTNESDLNDELVRFEPDIVLCDYTMPGFSGARALDIVHHLRPATPVLMFSGSICEETAVDCLKRGATDYLLKSNLRRLGPAVRRAIDDKRERQALEHQIETLSDYDTLTGLPNLSHMSDFVSRAIGNAQARRQLVSLVVLNIDGFRFIDETLGRHLADSVLREISAVIKARSREQDMIARVGADEFLAVLSDIGNAGEAALLAQELLAAAASRHLIAGHEIQVSASAGVAVYPHDGADFETLLCRSTEAMHEAKKQARGSLLFHSADVVRKAHQQRRLETELRDAIQSAQLTLHYQPQYDLRTGRSCGVEALARWYRADGQTISPTVFIPIAEEAGLIGDLGTWALGSACRTAVRWTRDGVRLPVLSVNVSTQQICPAFTGIIKHALEASGLPAERLELEITESVLIGNVDLTLDCLASWKRLGVRIAVDDFGTGYSSLNYLSRLPIDRLKMDKSLIQQMTTQAREATIVRAVVTLGRELGFTVLAEGVETEEQLAMLVELGCQQAQGYLLTPPTLADRAAVLMGKRWGQRQAIHDSRSRTHAAKTSHSEDTRR